jgi:hypothetical protein
VNPGDDPKHTDRVVLGIVLGAAIAGTVSILAFIVLILWYFVVS